MRETLAEIEAPHFNCGIVMWDDKVVVAAPIVGYMKGWNRSRVRDHCAAKGWQVCVIHELKRTKP